MGKASRDKGKRGELAAREALLALTGREWRRSAMRQATEKLVGHRYGAQVTMRDTLVAVAEKLLDEATDRETSLRLALQTATTVGWRAELAGGVGIERVRP